MSIEVFHININHIIHYRNFTFIENSKIYTWLTLLNLLSANSVICSHCKHIFPELYPFAELAYKIASKLLPSISKPLTLTKLSHSHPYKPISSQCKPTSIIKPSLQTLSDHPNTSLSLFLEKGFSEIPTLPTLKTLHAFCLKNSIHLSVFHTNTLINMYSKFGCTNLSRYLFDEMPQRSESTYSTMISGYVKGEMYVEAVDMFREMWVEEGVEPNGFMIASLLTACSRLGSVGGIRNGREVHGLVVKFGLILCDVYVGTALLHFYGTYGFMRDTRMVFDEMPVKNIVSWTSLMVGYSSDGNPEEVMRIYERMRREGVCCNQNSFAKIISSCGLLEDEFLGRQVFCQVMVLGFESNVSVANALISMFGCFGSMEDACFLFDGMVERDIISWNSMISAYSRNFLCKESLVCFYKMCRANVKPNPTTLSTLVSACSSVDYIKWGMGVHGAIFKFGLESNTCVSNTLLTMYSESGRCEDAVRLFHEIPGKDLITFNSMMASYVHNGEYRDALQLLSDLKRENEIRNHVTYASALAACSSPDALMEGKTVHALIYREGIHENVILGNALITMYGKCDVISYAERVFATMPQHDVVSWNALIGGHMENEEPHKSVQYFKSMRKEGMPANYITMVNVLGSFSDPEDLLTHGMPVHAHAVLTGFDIDSFVRNALLTMYAKCGDLNSSNQIFEQLDSKNVVSWNAMIAAYSHNGRGEAALKLFAEMHHGGLEFDRFTFSGGLAGSANLGLLEEGQQLHSLIIKIGFESDLHVINAAMDMYGKCGEMEEVLQLLPIPRNRSRLSWNILISGFSRHGYFMKARETFHEMLQVGPKPDHVTFVSLLSSCNHGGLVDEGLAYFSSMTKDFGVPPGIEHCVCIIDLLGRSGRLIDAETFVNEMPVPPNDLVWRSLLSASRTHNNLELSRKAAKHLLELDPSDDSAYVLLSNACATTGRWEDVDTIRNKMKVNKIRKNPACSWIKANNKVSSFGIGDQSHPEAEQIYKKLMDLRNKIKEAGYVADTSFALHDTDEEQKEHNLWNHSERLALAFGLIHSPEGSTLRIFKNLRVCGDCHSVYKFVSKAVGRKIVLRDPYRFHHFDDGNCSCGDYW